METVKVGMREFRDNLANYVLQGGAPVAVTRHGDTVGYFIPTRRRPSQEQLEAFQASAARWQQEMERAGVTEEELIEDFTRLRKADRK